LRPAGREGVVNIPYTPTDKPQKALSVIHIGGLRGKTGNADKESPQDQGRFLNTNG
jgi:hypothetical protein